MEKESRALPPEKGDRMLKMRPGIVIRPLKRKNQRRLPIRSNTRPRLPSVTPRRRGRELVLAHAVEACTARPGAAHDPAQDAAADGDGREHGDQHADDQDEGEAADRPVPAT